MGIIRKQSVVGSILVYAGAALGFLTSAILLPRFFSQEQIGLLSLLVTYSVLFAQFGSAGFLHTINRMFPYFRNDEKKHNGFLFFTLLVVSIASIIMIGVYFIAEPFITSNSSADNNLLSTFAFLIIPLFIFTVFFNILDFYAKALFNATRGIFLKEVLLRVIILVLIILYIWKSYSFDTFVYLYIAAFGAILLYLIISLIVEKQFHLKPDFTLLDKPMRKEIGSVSMYGIIISAAGFIILNIDRVMIEKLVTDNPLAQVGIYATCTYFSTMIILPSRPLLKIASTLVAEAWKSNNKAQIQEMYTKSTITQLIIGILVFVGIAINIDYIFQIIPETYKSGKWVIIFIGLFYLSDMASGVNNTIIGASPKYKVLSHMTLVLIVLIIGLNFIFIPLYGITGAAVAAFISKLLYNIFTYVFLKKKYGFEPYNWNHVKIIGIAFIAYFTAFGIPEMGNLFLNIGIKSSVVVLVFTYLILKLQVSEDVNEMAKKVLMKFVRR